MPYLDCSPTSGSCRLRSSSACSTSRPGSSAAPAPSRSCSTGPSRRRGPEGRRDLRGQLRRLPPGRAGEEQRDVARRALRGPAHRLRPVPARLEAALPADRAVDRQLPGQRPRVPQPAVPLVLGDDEPDAGRKFWRTKLPLYMRLCYFTGLVDYVYTAVFTFLPRPWPSHAAVRPWHCAAEPDLHRAGPGLRGRDLPDVAPRAVPPGGLAVRVIPAGRMCSRSRTCCAASRGAGSRPARRGKQEGRRRLWIGLIGWSTPARCCGSAWPCGG